jgi:hypothetical protein
MDGPFAGHSPFTEEISANENTDDRLTPVPGRDRQFDAAAFQVEDRVLPISFREDHLTLLELKRCLPAARQP